MPQVVKLYRIWSIIKKDRPAFVSGWRKIVPGRECISCMGVWGIKFVWKITWWPACVSGGRYFDRVDYITKKVSVGYMCRRLPTAIVYY